MKETLSASTEYPVFWWNFIVQEKGSSPAICDALKKLRPQWLSRVECQFKLDDEREFLKSWQEDVFLRVPWPGREGLAKSMDQGLAQASLPGLGSLMENLRLDPLGQLKALAKISEDKLKIPFTKRDGFFQDEATGRIIIPVQMSFPPMNTAVTKEVFQALNGFDFEMVGPHASTLNNESQVIQDSNLLSIVSVVVMALSLALMAYFKKWNLLLLVPPVIVGVSLAALATILVFGSVHVITLTFGVGLIGLAFDYGVHGAFGVDSPGVWKSNLYGYLTTLVGFIILSFSDIPLIRQMMVFAVFGITASYFIYFFLIRRYPDAFRVLPFHFSTKTNGLKVAFIVFLMASFVIGAFTVRPRLDMAAFDYRPPHLHDLSSWLMKSLAMEPPLFRVAESEKALSQSAEELKFSNSQGILIETLATYLPTEDVQKENLESWLKACPIKLAPQHEKFYEPFLGITPCTASREPLGGGSAQLRTYAKGLYSQGKWLTMWFPKTEAQAATIRDHFEGVTSLKEMAQTFPKILSREASWMTWLFMGLAIVLIYIHTRNLFYTGLSIVPFLSGGGLVVLTSILFHIDISFISLVGFIMLFGLGLDYGIFVTDMLRDPYPSKHAGVMSALLLNATSNMAGLCPLLFCKHPILLHLGHTLFFGSLGMYLGAIWGIPGLFKLKRA